MIFNEDQEPLAMIWLIPALILASLLFNFKQTLIINGVAILAAAGAVASHPDAVEAGVLRILATIVIIASLLPIGTKIRDDDELIIASQNKELSDLNQKLESRVLARTAQLNEAKEVAEKASQVKSAFLANMSHELRTPLNAIIGYSELITSYVGEDDYSDKELVHDIGRIGHSGKHLLLLIDQVLDYATIEAGDAELLIEGVSSADIVKRTLSIMKPFAEKAGIELELRNHLRSPIFFHTDLKRTCQILINLLDNALKFTYEGQVFLEVDTAEYQNERHLSFCVEDTGIGIPKDIIDEIFDSFRQVKNDHSRRHDGAGLGLTISKEYSEMLGGHILVESQEGVGSKFTLLLPLVRNQNT